jgi:uncharacterized membrane protein YqhA
MKFLLEKSKYLGHVAVLVLLLTFVLSLFWASVQAYNLWLKIVLSIGQASGIILMILKVIDAFLIAIMLYILAVSIYKLFIGEVQLSSHLVAANLSELKSKLSSVIVLVMAIHFVEIFFEDGYSGIEKLWQAIAAALVIGVLIAFGYLRMGQGNKDHQP